MTDEIKKNNIDFTGNSEGEKIPENSITKIENNVIEEKLQKTKSKEILLKPDYNKLDVTINRVEEIVQQPDYNRLDVTMKMKYTDEKEKAKKFYKEALRFSDKGRRHEALEAFQKTVEYDPDFTEAYKKLARLYKEAKDKDTAAEYYKEYLRLLPRNNEALSFLFNLYLDRKNPVEAADILSIKIETVKNTDKKKELLKQAATLYLLGKAYDKSLETYHKILRDEVFNPEIFRRLAAIYKYREEQQHWKVCEQVLLLNRKITRDKITKPMQPIKAPGPLTTEMYDQMIHPGEKAFKRFFGWMKPMFSLMESETPPDVLRLSESVPGDSHNYSLFKDCCHYLNMETIPLRHYTGDIDFKFIADPLGGDAGYSLIYNDRFFNRLTPPEKTFLLINHLVIIKSGFTPLLNLCISDMARIFIEIASTMLSFLNILQAIPIDKAAGVVKKSSKTAKFLDFFKTIQKKLKSFKLLGKNADEMEALVKKSAEMIPRKQMEEEGISFSRIMNTRFLETALQGFFHTADRISYYMTRDLVAGTRSLFHLLAGSDALERVEKFGLQPYILETKNTNLKNRLGELFYFAIDSDIMDEVAPDFVDVFRKLEE